MKRIIKVKFVIFVLVVFLISCAQAQGKKVENTSSLPVTTVPADVLSQLPAATERFEWHLYNNVIFQMPIDWNKKGSSPNRVGKLT